jgi:hypothetical protein
MQMRCVGSLNPPCDRCAKAKRHCVISERHRASPLQTRMSNTRIDGNRHGIDRPHHDDRSYHRPAECPRSDTTLTQISDRTIVTINGSPGDTAQASSQSSAIARSESSTDAHQQRRLVLPSVYSISPLTSADLESAYMTEEQNSRPSHDTRSPLSPPTSNYSGQTNEISLTELERDIYHLVDL